MSELLTSLKTKKIALDAKILKLTNGVHLSNIKSTSLMREILADKFPKIQEVLISRDITIQVRSDDNRFTHDVTISNITNCGFGTFSYNPRLAWNSGSISRSSVTYISYINIIAFISSEIMKEDSEFSKLMENAWSSVYNKNNELINLKNELARTLRDTENEESRIKKESFFATLKNGNFYYKVRNNYGRNIYDIIHVDKINRKTIAISMTHITGEESNPFDGFDKGSLETKRIKHYQIYSILNDFVLFDRKNFNDILLDNKFKTSVDYVRKNNGLTSVMDIKILCQKLKDNGFTTEKIPTNDILHYISKWRHYTLENNRS